jgi:hypothetical protein
MLQMAAIKSTSVETNCRQHHKPGVFTPKQRGCVNMKPVNFAPDILNQSTLTKQVGAVRSVLIGLLVVVSMLLSLSLASFAAPLLPVPVSTSPSNKDVNPYGVLFVLLSGGIPVGTLRHGDILVSNFNNSANVMGTGTTIVDIRNGAQVTPPFYTATPGNEGVDLALGQLGNFIIVGNVPVSGTHAGPGALTVLNSQGKVVNMITDTSIDGPWGLAITSSGSSATLYVSNLLNGTVWRLDGTTSTTSGFKLNSETQIGGNFGTMVNFPTAANGPAGLAYDSAHDILYVASEVNNKIYAISMASTRGTTNTRGTVVYSDPTNLHGPTGLLLLLNGDLLTANDDGVNVAKPPANPSALVEFTSKGKFVTQLSIDPTPGGAFGIGSNSNGNKTLLAYVDDNQVTLSVLSLFLQL